MTTANARTSTTHKESTMNKATWNSTVHRTLVRTKGVDPKAVWPEITKARKEGLSPEEAIARVTQAPGRNEAAKRRVAPPKGPRARCEAPTQDGDVCRNTRGKCRHHEGGRAPAPRKSNARKTQEALDARREMHAYGKAPGYDYCEGCAKPNQSAQGITLDERGYCQTCKARNEAPRPLATCPGTTKAGKACANPATMCRYHGPKAEREAQRKARNEALHAQAVELHGEAAAWAYCTCSTCTFLRR